HSHPISWKYRHFQATLVWSAMIFVKKRNLRVLKIILHLTLIRQGKEFRALLTRSPLLLYALMIFLQLSTRAHHLRSRHLHRM
ncbi:hypothetical protein GCK32_012047, partial [Trichostrongylus colubriformis]